MLPLDIRYVVNASFVYDGDCNQLSDFQKTSANLIVKNNASKLKFIVVTEWLIMPHLKGRVSMRRFWRLLTQGLRGPHENRTKRLLICQILSFGVFIYVWFQFSAGRIY